MNALNHWWKRYMRLRAIKLKYQAELKAGASYTVELKAKYFDMILEELQ